MSIYSTRARKCEISLTLSWTHFVHRCSSFEGQRSTFQDRIKCNRRSNVRDKFATHALLGKSFSTFTSVVFELPAFPPLSRNDSSDSWFYPRWQNTFAPTFHFPVASLNVKHYAECKFDVCRTKWVLPSLHVFISFNFNFDFCLTCLRVPSVRSVHFGPFSFEQMWSNLEFAQATSLSIHSSENAIMTFDSHLSRMWKLCVSYPELLSEHIVWISRHPICLYCK